MLEIKDTIPRIAATAANVLIRGETGTGKELAASMIHARSARAGRPLIAVNCAAIPDGLVESELFGYERGAFTGAFRATPGKLEQANGGTLFLDEVGDMSLAAQAKVLRAIETKDAMRLGGRTAVPLDVRIVAATNQDLKTMVTQKLFRADLYYRLNVTSLHLPPLRERKADICTLAVHFLRTLCKRAGHPPLQFSADVARFLVEYHWPGNVRQLRNVIESAIIYTRGAAIEMRDLPADVEPPGAFAEAAGGEVERVLQALLETRWNKTAAARKLNWSRMTLYRKLEHHRIGLDSRERAAGA